MAKRHNIMLVGVGGQGLITLTQIIGRAARLNGFEFRSSELHGLSQRGGSVEIHIRLGNKINSPLITPGDLDVVLALENQESLSGIHYASDQIEFLVNEYQTPTLAESVSDQEVLEKLKQVTKRIKPIPASQICKKELNSEVVAGVFMLGYAVQKNLFGLKPDLFKKAIEQELPEKYWELNKKAFELGQSFT